MAPSFSQDNNESPANIIINFFFNVIKIQLCKSISMKILDSVELGRLILSFYNLITNYSRIIQNSELEDLAQDHRYYQGWALDKAILWF